MQKARLNESFPTTIERLDGCPNSLVVVVACEAIFWGAYHTNDGHNSERRRERERVSECALSRIGKMRVSHFWGKLQFSRSHSLSSGGYIEELLHAVVSVSK